MMSPGVDDQGEDWLNTIQVVLVNTTEAGNIGAAARAIKTMGLSQLVLVCPKDFPSAKATARASGADDILANVVVVDSLAEALKDCGLVMGTSARIRGLPWPLLNPRQAAQQAWENRHLGSKTALVFGSEQSGLSNEELDCCQYQIRIPCNPAYSSLNLAACVQVIAYEMQNRFVSTKPATGNEEPLASQETMDYFYSHLFGLMQNVGYLPPQQPKLLHRRLRRLFNGMRLSEANIMCGLLNMIDNQLNNI